MLPDFPKLKSEVHSYLLAKIRNRVKYADPVLSQVKRFTQYEGREFKYERFEAANAQLSSEAIETSFQVLLEEVPDLIGAKLDAKLEEMARELARKEARFFFRRVHEDCEEVGNSVNAEGQPLTPELLLEILSKVQVGFAPDGSPKGQFVIHPDMAPALKKVGEEIENNAELKRKHEDIVKRQREEWDIREGNRKLVD